MPEVYSPAEIVTMAWDKGMARSKEIVLQTEGYFDEALGLAGAANSMTPAYLNFDASVAEPLVEIPRLAEGASVAQFGVWWDSMIDKLAGLYAGYIDRYFPNDCAYLQHAQHWICEQITKGGSGINASIEAQIWARDRDRIQQEYAATERETIGTFAARGFPMPPGAAMAVVQRARADAAAKTSAASRDLAIKQMELEIENVRFAVDKAIGLYSAATDAARGYMTALAGTSGNVTQLLPSVTDSQSRLISAASGFYQSRIAAQELRLKASMPSHEWEQQAKVRNLDAQTAAANAKVQAAIEAAKALSNQAAAMLNTLHVGSSTSASGGHSVSYSYSGDVSSDVPPHTV